MTPPMTHSEPAREAVAQWRYSINYGPDGEANYANVHAADGQFVGNLRTHHAIAICNAFAVCEKLASPPPPAASHWRRQMIDEPFATKGLTGAAQDVLWQLFRNGPTWDGDLASKSGRNDLVDLEYADRGDGWNWLTTPGVLLALELGLGKKKEARR